MTDADQLLQDLLDDQEDEWDLTDALIDLVIQTTDSIATRVNSQGMDEQLRWLLEQGVSVEEINSYVKG